jgi:hypothetical protein
MLTGGDMIGTDLNHCQIVRETLAGVRTADEQALASLAVLKDRLARLKQTQPALAGVTLSPQAESLAAQAGPIAVG